MAKISQSRKEALAVHGPWSLGQKNGRLQRLFKTIKFNHGTCKNVYTLLAHIRHPYLSIRNAAQLKTLLKLGRLLE